MARFAVEHERTDAHDHYLSAEHEWRVIDTATGECLFTFDERYDGASATGVQRVEISEDEREAVVTYHDDRVMRVPLPG